MDRGLMETEFGRRLGDGSVCEWWEQHFGVAEVCGAVMMEW